MSHPHLILLWLEIAAMLGAAILFGLAARRCHLPALLGELLAGIVLGPSVLGLIAPGFQAWLFPSHGLVADFRGVLVQLGLLLFVFVAGQDINLAYLKGRGSTVAWAGSLGILIPFALGAGMVWGIPEIWRSGSDYGLFILGIFMGTALSISALPVIARTLVDLGLMKRELGMVIMASAMVDDLVGWALFAGILAYAAPESSGAETLVSALVTIVVLVVLTLTAGRSAGRRGFRWMQNNLPWPSGFIGVSILLVLVVASVTQALGIHAVFGALLVGAALAQNSNQRHQAHETLYQFVISFFAPLYFVSIGLQANFVAGFDPLLVLIVLAVGCLAKVGGVTWGARLGGMAPREALAVGLGMNARGAMGMILASMALDFGLIDQRVFVALIVLALVTSVLSGPLMKSVLRISSHQHDNDC